MTSVYDHYLTLDRVYAAKPTTAQAVIDVITSVIPHTGEGQAYFDDDYAIEERSLWGVLEGVGWEVVHREEDLWVAKHPDTNQYLTWNDGPLFIGDVAHRFL